MKAETEPLKGGRGLTHSGNLKPNAGNDQRSKEAASIAEKIDLASLREHLSSSFGIRNRFTAKDRIIQVENYLFQKFEEYGWKTERQRYHFETFEGNDEEGRRKTYRDIAGVNVIATKPGKNPNETLLVGAHYDTVDDSPGADDNGTGVAALLEVARVLGKSNFSKRSFSSRSTWRKSVWQEVKPSLRTSLLTPPLKAA